MPRLLLFLAMVALAPCCAPAAEDLGIQVPEGFEVSLYADDALAHDIFSMTIDAQGRVVVAGMGYVKTLIDDDRDGRADRAQLFSNRPASGAHGMFFDGPHLICTGDNSVMRLVDRDGDGTADGEPEVWTSLRHPEHGANGLVRGPDGCFYLVCGNDAGIARQHAATSTSPVQDPRCGGIVRFSPEGKVLDVFAHGFRNPYDLDFDADGHLFTVDSDGERDHHLPWYAPTRLFDVAQGMEHGWMLKGWTQSWNRPQSFYDNVERAAEIGRGSPTGLLTYRHRQFPAHYRGGVFSACWTFGRVYYLPLTAAEAGCTAQVETFMQTTGDIGFAPCDLAVGPDGDLFVAIGGRRTRGSVFRVRYLGQSGVTAAADVLTGVLEADQPQASWSRARWVPAARELGAAAFERAAADEKLNAAARVRAIEVLVELFGGLKPEATQACVTSTQPRVRARAAWALGRGAESDGATKALCALTSDDDASVQRAAWEALAMRETLSAESADQPDWSRGLTSPERRVRSAAIALAKRAGSESYRQFASRVRIASNAWPLRLAQLWIKLPESSEERSTVFSRDDLQLCLDAFSASSDVATRLECVRLLQIALGDVSLRKNQFEVYAGYQAGALDSVSTEKRTLLADRLTPVFPTSDPELNRELARLLGMLAADQAGLRAGLARQWTPSSSVEDDIHYLIVASLLPSQVDADVRRATVEGLLGLHRKLDAAGQSASRNWPLRVAEVFDELCRRDPAFAETLVASPHFNHLGHTIFAERLQGDVRQQAIRRLWDGPVAGGQEPTAELVLLSGKLPFEEAARRVRAAWDQGALRDAIVLVLARQPRSEDRQKFVEALNSPQPEVVGKAAKALETLGIRSTPAEMAAVLRALKQACSQAKQTEPRTTLVRLLEFWTEDGADIDWDPDPTKMYVGWYKLFADYYPAEAAKLQASSTTDAGAWRRRLDTVDWNAGESAAGKLVFERRLCHRCHQVSGHLGPELKGAVSRMSRQDLFTAILDPDLEVAPAYLTTAVATAGGQVYHGLVVYESPEGTLLQTGPDTTVRITDVEASSMRTSTRSLMPTGLLDTLSDRELSDLYAYLRTLGSK